MEIWTFQAAGRVTSGWVTARSAPTPARAKKVLLINKLLKPSSLSPVLRTVVWISLVVKLPIFGPVKNLYNFLCISHKSTDFI